MALPEPYYDRDGITIFCADCRDVLPHLPPVDLVLTDPPYGLDELWQGGGGSVNSSWAFDPKEAMEWDSDTVDCVTDLPTMAPMVVIWGGNYYALPPSRCWFLWDKKQNDQWTTGQAEMAWTNIARPVRMFRMAQAEQANEGPKLHPTQKPIALMRWCIKMTRLETGTILDPFMGSGTTLRAAMDMGFSAIGIEKSERYCEIAVKRLQQSVMRLEIPT